MFDSLPGRVLSITPFDFPGTLSKRWNWTHFVNGANWGSERAGDAPRLTQLSPRPRMPSGEQAKGAVMPPPRTLDGDQISLSSIKGLTQDDRANPPEILSRYRRNCHFLKIKKWSNISSFLWFNLKQSMQGKCCISRKFCCSMRNRSCNVV